MSSVNHLLAKIDLEAGRIFAKKAIKATRKLAIHSDTEDFVTILEAYLLPCQCEAIAKALLKREAERAAFEAFQTGCATPPLLR